LEIASQHRALAVTDDARRADYLARNEIDVFEFQDLRNLNDE